MNCLNTPKNNQDNKQNKNKTINNKMATIEFSNNNFVNSKLNYFIQNRKIPNIVFHGSSGCGKRTIVGEFINRIYNGDRAQIKNNIMFVNCAHGKGIKFIRDELKYFAKTNIQCNNNTLFKSIVLYNADELTIDAQSALRRCIELFSHNTRFFIVVENKHKLLKPILSRFCEIYIPDKIKDEENVEYDNLHIVNRENTYGTKEMKRDHRISILEPILKPIIVNGLGLEHTYKWFLDLANRLYEDGISCLDIIQYLEKDIFLSLDRDELKESLRKKMIYVHFCFNKIKGEFRLEKMLIFYMFDYMFLRLDCSFKNISFL